MTETKSEATARNALDRALDFSDGLAEFCGRHLGDRLLGFYKIGSLGHGGFSARYSDIDLAVIVEDPLSPDEVALIQQAAGDLSPDLAPKLSLFWADRAFSAGRFPPLDRIDLLDNAVVITERQRVRPERPSLADVRAYLGGEPLKKFSDRVDEFTAISGNPKAYMRAHLYPARFVFSWLTGSVASSDDAVAWTRANRPAGIDVDALECALQRRQQDLDPVHPLLNRAVLIQNRDACVRLAQTAA